MSVNYKAGLIYGWEITKKEYESLDEEIKDNYAINTDMICDMGQYFIGDIQTEASNENTRRIHNEHIDMPKPVYDLIKKALPDLINILPNPTLYLYCRVF